MDRVLWISKDSNICEIGCGEGRDAISLAEKGFNITAVDISKEAIKKCKELLREKSVEVNWIVSDVIDLQKDVNMKFDYIYSIGTLHMLVEDEDRNSFLKSIYSLLKPNGKVLLVNMGDGKEERQTDITKAFELVERNLRSGEQINVASTSFRCVNVDYHGERA